MANLFIVLGIFILASIIYYFVKDGGWGDPPSRPITPTPKEPTDDA